MNFQVVLHLSSESDDGHWSFLPLIRAKKSCFWIQDLGTIKKKRKQTNKQLYSPKIHKDVTNIFLSAFSIFAQSQFQKYFFLNPASQGCTSSSDIPCARQQIIPRSLPLYANKSRPISEHNEWDLYFNNVLYHLIS